jgi:hypothetical protein
LKESIVDGLSVEFVSKTYLEANYYTKEEVDARTIDPIDLQSLKNTVAKLDGGVETEGSVKYQINEAKEDLIGTSEDLSSQDTINAAKNLVAESFQFINYNN